MIPDKIPDILGTRTRLFGILTLPDSTRIRLFTIRYPTFCYPLHHYYVLHPYQFSKKTCISKLSAEVLWVVGVNPIHIFITNDKRYLIDGR